MDTIANNTKINWGLQLPVQAQSTLFAQPWEATAGPKELAEVAIAAEGAGADYVGVCDHTAIPKAQAGAMGTTWYETVATLGWLAAQTDSVRLLSHVLVLPYRHPLMVAKAFSTLDHLSGGRMILGVGAGHVEDEFAALGVDFGSRGSAVASGIETIRRVFHDEFIDVGIDADVDAPTGTVRVGIAPRPIQAGGPPIWVGGSSKAAITRAALLGDGWLPQGRPKMGTRAAIEFIHQMRAQNELPEAFEVGMLGGPVFIGRPEFDIPEGAVTGEPEQIAERYSSLGSVGVTQIQFQFLGVDCAQVCDQILRFGAQVAPLLER